MWTATWALNTLIGLGKRQDWMVHMIGHSVGAWTHAPHCLPLTISEIGATADMITGITEGTICYPAGYMDLKPEDVAEILKESL